MNRLSLNKLLVLATSCIIYTPYVFVSTSSICISNTVQLVADYNIYT